MQIRRGVSQRAPGKTTLLLSRLPPPVQAPENGQSGQVQGRKQRPCTNRDAVRPSEKWRSDGCADGRDENHEKTRLKHAILGHIWAILRVISNDFECPFSLPLDKLFPTPCCFPYPFPTFFPSQPTPVKLIDHCSASVHDMATEQHADFTM